MENKYPDLTIPLKEAENYPDLTKPLKNNVIDDLLMKAEEVAEAPQMKREPYAYEQYSNPTSMPGFDELPKEEKLRQIKESQFHPANTGPMGLSVNPGRYESEAERMVGSVLPFMFAPEISVGKNLLSRMVVNPLLNAGSRVGQGVASNLLYESPYIKDKEQLKESAKESLKNNLTIEGLTMPFRGPAWLSELYYGKKFALQKLNDIKDDYSGAVAAQKSAYRPVTQQYGADKVTNTPIRFTGLTKEQKRYMTPNLKKAYQDFKDAKDFDSLHRFQSTAGKEAAIFANNPNRIKTYQTLMDLNKSLKQKAENFLANDKIALAQYKLGGEITKNYVKPFEANKALKEIIFGTRSDISAPELRNAIKQGTQKIKYRRGIQGMPVIPQGHGLRNHLKELEQAINIGNAAQFLVPTIAGAAVGNEVSPGYMGIGAGAIAGMTSAGLSNFMQHFGHHGITNFVANPAIERVFRATEKPYYAGARIGTNVYNESKK